MKLLGKLFINGKIKALTGLHIGGSKTDVAIGDIENCVIKTSEGVPYIPGSSLKGKLRSLLEKKEGLVNEDQKKEEQQKKEDQKNQGLHIHICGKKDCKICVIFGSAAEKRSEETGPTRLIVRDCHLTEETRRKMENKEGEFRELEMDYTESKWENVIDRITSRAFHPRPTERVPQGAEFEFQMVFNIMETEDIERFKYLISGLSLLEDDYLGGSGSRGYGRVEFRDLEIRIKTMKDYEGANEATLLYTGNLKDSYKAEFKEKLQKMLED